MSSASGRIGALAASMMIGRLDRARRSRAVITPPSAAGISRSTSSSSSSSLVICSASVIAGQRAVVLERVAQHVRNVEARRADSSRR